MSVINQKEYLKKYLGIGKESKKKKKRKIATSRLKIFDDNVDIFSEAVKNDLVGDDEDAPQIVAVIDDRPPSLRTDENESNLWSPIGKNSSNFGEENNEKLNLTFNKKKSEFQAVNSQKLQKSSSSMRHSVSKDIICIENSTFQENDKSSLTDISSDNHLKGHDSSRPRCSNEKFSLIQQTQVKDVDMSPPRRFKIKSISQETQVKDEDMSPPRRFQIKSISQDDLSPPRVRQSSHKIKSDPVSERTNESSTSKKRCKKTLDGKTAGLQNAKELKEEVIKIKQREDELFKNIPSELLGINAATVVRGRNRIEDNEESNKEKQKKIKESEEKYMKWGRGLKQVDDINAKISENLKEMNKPLARYADDEDLESYLKEQLRDGDPMAYLFKKKRKKETDNHSTKPTYMGDFMPNRFGITPGYRWDGVDRSNGYEKKWFEVQNSKMAQQEETYKWSTEDM